MLNLGFSLERLLVNVGEEYLDENTDNAEGGERVQQLVGLAVGTEQTDWVVDGVKGDVDEEANHEHAVDLGHWHLVVDYR